MNKIILIFTTLLLITACSTPTTLFPSTSKDEVDTETKFQQALFDKKKVESEKHQMENRLKYQEQLNIVSQRIMPAGAHLCNEMDRAAAKGCIFEFEMDKSNTVNAYADGKKIIVTEGMMRFIKTDEELAVVLGHEYAHNIMGHIEAKKNNVTLGNFVGAIIDTVASTQGIGTAGTFGELGTYAGAHGYSKEFEKEADYVGLYIDYIAGYDIDQAPEFWRRMSVRDQKSIHDASDHPTNPERYIALGKTIREIKRKKQSDEPILPNMAKKNN